MEVVLEDKSIDNGYTVIFGRETRPISPEPASSPCPNLHTVTPLGSKIERDSNHSNPQHEEPVVVRAVHHCSALHAAIVTGDAEEVRNLLEKGQVNIDVLNSYDCSGSQPICEAAYHNRVEIMKLILDCNDSHVNVINRLGLTPAHIAAGIFFDSPDMINLLIAHNADISKRSKDGRLPLHIAAETGHYRIVRALLQSKKLTDKVKTETFVEGNVYLPPPIILAAASHHYQVVNVLRKDITYPMLIESDIDLIFWSLGVLSAYRKGVSPNPATFESLEMALRGREDSVIVPPSLKKFRGSKEVRSTEDVREIASMYNDTKDHSIMILQCISILERTLGQSSKLLVSYIEKALSILCTLRVNWELVEALLIKSLHMMPLTEKQMMELGVYMMPSHLHVTISLSLTNGIRETHRALVVGGHVVNYVPFIREFMVILDTILELKSHQLCQSPDHWGENFIVMFCHLLAMLSAALYFSNHTPFPFGSRKALNDVATEILEKYDQHITENCTSFLHFALRKASPIVEIIKLSGLGGRNSINSYIQLIETLLLLGCSNVTLLNAPYKQFFCKGELPLHMAVRLAEMDPCYLPIVNTLFIHGAHYDGVSLNGVEPSQIASSPQLQALFDLKPLPLACIISKAIVKQKIGYEADPALPAHVKRYISYHDNTTY